MRVSDDWQHDVHAAIREAVRCLTEASTAQPESSSTEFALWKASAEAEYAAFRVSIANSLSDYPVRIRLPNPASVIGNDMAQAKELMESSAALLESNPKGAYKNLRRAIALLRRAQSQILRPKAQGSGNQQND